MNVKESSLQALKCYECDCYLSIPPIMMNENYENICGRCYIELDDVKLVNNYAYEALACHMLFPCRYKDKGCGETLPWNRAQYHEEGCEFQTYKCLMYPIGSCEWEGFRSELLAHFEEKHPDSILQHPCVIKPDIRRNSERNFLISAHGFLFLLQTKCSIAAAKLYYCVRFLGYVNLATLFDFTVDMKTSLDELKKTKVVATQENITFEKENFIVIGINSMLVNLGDYSDISFTLTINKIVDKFKVLQCFYCDFFINSSEVKEDINYCKNCSFSNKIIKCCKYKHLGCSYTDISLNVRKHEKWLCIYDQIKYQSKKCILCRLEKKYLNFNHFEKHRITTLNAMNTIYESFSNSCSVIYDNTIFTCFWKLENNILVFKIISNIPKTENKIYKCTLRLFNPYFSTSMKKTLYHNMKSLEYDWIIKIKNECRKPFVDVRLNSNYDYSRGSKIFIESYGLGLEINRNDIRKNDTFSKLLLLWYKILSWPWKNMLIIFSFTFLFNFVLNFLFSIDYKSYICPKPVQPICPKPVQPICPEPIQFSSSKTVFENILETLYEVILLVFKFIFGLIDQINL